MKLIASILSELLGLFVDDGKLALQLLFLVTVIGVLVSQKLLSPGLGVGLLVLGCILILAYSLARFLRR